MKKLLPLFFIFISILQAGAVCPRKLIASVPFELAGTYVVINVKINNSSTLKLILDTGVRNTIITELQSDDEVSLNFTEIKDIQGLGTNQILNAYIAHNNILNIGKLKLYNKTVHVLKEDVFNLSRQTGTKVNGLLGADIFQNHIVQIDYSRRRIFFYDPDGFIPPDKYGYMPMTIEKQKMYIHLSILEKDTARRSIKMLMDTGAELTAWFQTLTNKAISIPEKSIKGRIGQGLSGEITGYFARVPQICISNFCVKNPIVAFPDSAAIAEIIKNSDRDGTIGCRLLSRFNLIIDVMNRKFYFKPNSHFNDEFTYNIAGIEVVQPMLFLPQFEIINVWKGSPADVAGIKAGDMITEINGEKLFSYTVNEVKSFFERSTKRPMTITVQRNNENLTFQVDMKARI
jgi:hypothetical protein